MKYTLLTLLVLSSLLLAGCATPSSTPTDTNPTVNAPTADDADMDEKNEDNDDMDDDADKNEAGEDENDDDDMDDQDEDDNDDNKNDAAVNTPPADTTTIYAMSDIAANNTESSCRTTIRGNVYNLSARIDAHPWGDRNILRLCGIDGTAAFEGKHGGKEGPETTLAGFQIGIVQ